MPKEVSEIFLFQHIKQQLKRYALPDILETSIPPETPTSLVEYEYGDEVWSDGKFVLPKSLARFNADKVLAIVLKGCVELCDVSVVGNKDRKIAYRPIRVAEPLDVLGEFSIIDAAFCDQPSERSGEKWCGIAGVRSIYCRHELSAAQVTTALIKSGIDRGRIKHHHTIHLNDALSLSNVKQNGYKTVVGYLDLRNISPEGNPEFWRWITRIAWNRCIQYRRSFHAFNYHRLVSYRLNAKAQTSKERAEKKKDKTDKWSKGHIGSVDLHDIAVPEMLFDAINRPLRNEPVFASVGVISKKKVEDMLPIAQLNKFIVGLRAVNKKINFGDFLVPVMLDKNAPEQYYFPVDEQNYFLAQWVSSFDGPRTTRDKLTTNRIGKSFLKTIVKHCIDSEELYDLAHSDGSRPSENEVHFRCVLEMFDKQMFCAYRKQESDASE